MITAKKGTALHDYVAEFPFYCSFIYLFIYLFFRRSAHGDMNNYPINL